MNRVVLLIAHYNNPRGLTASVASVSASDRIDIVIVDDGSRTPPDEAAVRAAFLAQGEVKFIYLPANVGPEEAANAGLRYIQSQNYEYVARLDCGDLNFPDRFQKQVAFLDSHRDIALLGGAVLFFDETGDRFVHRLPCDPEHIQRHMHVNCAFIQPSMMFRADALEQTGLYPRRYPAADDFAFCWLFVERFKTANLPDILIRTEYNFSGVSLSRRRRQQWSRIRILCAHFEPSVVALSGLGRALFSLVVPLSLIRGVRRLMGKKEWA